MVAGALQSGVEPQSAEPPLLLLTALLLFPLSSDPLHRVPRSRLGLWPLAAGHRAALRLAAVVLSPVLWVALAALMLKTRRPALGLLFLLTALAVPALASLGRQVTTRCHWSGLLWIPAFPGRMGELIRCNTRQMLSTLDVYAALLIASGGAAYLYLNPHPDPEAGPILALMTALALSTYSQCLFGLDSAGSAMTRYRLLPLSGWQILFAKDAVFLGVLILLVLPLAAAPGMTFGLTALAIGHFPSLWFHVRQMRWRFTGGRVLAGVVQMVGGLMLGVTEHDKGPAALGVALALYIGSLYFSGRYWERVRSRPSAFL